MQIQLQKIYINSTKSKCKTFVFLFNDTIITVKDRPEPRSSTCHRHNHYLLSTVYKNSLQINKKKITQCKNGRRMQTGKSQKEAELLING